MIRFTRVVARDCFAYSLLDFKFEDGIHSIEGLNGSAKTSVFMTLMQGLFNRNAKGTRIEEVNNTITGKPYEIEVYFTKGADEYVVVNSRKTGAIEIFKNGKPKHVKRIPDNLKIIEDILGVDYSMFQDLVYQSPKSSINLLEKDSDASRKAFINNILSLDEIDSSLEKFKAKDKELSGKSGQLELLRGQIRKFEESVVEDYEKEQEEIDLSASEKIIEQLNKDRDKKQIDIAKAKVTLSTLKDDKVKCEEMKETLEHISEITLYLGKLKPLEGTLSELTDKQANLQLERQSIIRRMEEDQDRISVHSANAALLSQKLELQERIGNGSEARESIESLSGKLDRLVKEATTLETTSKSSTKELTKLLDYSIMGVCPTCNHSVNEDDFKDAVEALQSTVDTAETKLISLASQISLLQQFITESKLRESLVHKLAVVDASIKPCDKTAEEVSESLKVLAIDLRGIDTQLTNVSQNIETRKVHDDSQLELARLQGIPGTHLDYDKINKAYDKLVGIIKLDQISLEATEKMIAEELKTVKQHQEFNTIQRTIKAVNAQKKAYNDATKGKLEVLYREQESKEDQAALVKQWLQILGPKGFRVHKMQTFLGHLNSSMKKYSDMLSDGKIRCMFYMTEGEIDFTVTDCNKTIAWSCWSEGEKARVKMACLFAVLELLEIMGAVSFNVLALDEIFSALDHAGKEGLFRVLNYLKDRGRAIYTIAHTQLALDREYDSVVKAYKQEDGTTTITQ